MTSVLYEQKGSRPCVDLLKVPAGIYERFLNLYSYPIADHIINVILVVVYVSLRYQSDLFSSQRYYVEWLTGEHRPLSSSLWEVEEEWTQISRLVM